MSTLRNLTEYLQRNGFPNARAVPSADPIIEDDTVTITDKVHVQVNGLGGWLACVVQELDNGNFNFHPERETNAAILADLRTLFPQQQLQPPTS